MEKEQSGDVMHSMLENIIENLRDIEKEKGRAVAAIDGRCASGKTTLAARIQDICGCNVIHMDHFFLPMELRSEARMKEPGGNIDYDRFLQEVLLPLQKGVDFSYRPFDCRLQKMAEPIFVEAGPLTIVEGSYSCHPLFQAYYDYRIFLTIGEKEQLDRIKKRNGEEGAVMFVQRWIPLEELYFKGCKTEESCHMVVESMPG